ncbi:hypothetical protein [Alteriqipengyuania lutimaris]|uniref:Uncharacterized protein n=1 Tax=Alteriqipengyuania lutimaris TaxID=1538146 RepID=A0A395LGV8_9SPHN|nr:hypothetical protein [Alteriqipengyuania lutimaris]MBB3035261.1 hypothetical protein [Alteriqipengyuania lutimaris]RDS75855.1 hypothetical protein DL238_14320 [Alteriqipengyuania lutimaris]
MSKPSPQHPDLAANPTLTEREAFEAWQAHVDAGRIGTRAAPNPALLLRHMRNEEVLLGRAVSVTVHVREELRGR